MDLTFQYGKLRCNYGRQTLFCEAGPDFCDSIDVDKQLHKQFILRNPVHREVQHGPRFYHHVINTITAEYTTTGINHAEGGWPKDVNINDPETTQRYRRKIEKEDNYVNCVMNCARPMERLILQNNAINMYNTYFNELPKQQEIVKIDCRTVNVYRDPNTSKPDQLNRTVSSICWRPDGGHKFVVTYNNIDFDRIPLASTDCHIWDTENPDSPETTFTPPAVLLDLQYNPRNFNVFAGGLVNGQVVCYDTRQTMVNPIGISPPHISHRDLVSNVRFINAKSGKEFFSGSSDGTCKWWDLRNLEKPIDEMMIHVVPNTNVKQDMARTYGITCLEFEPTIPSRFMCGTENGYVIGGNRKGKSVVDILPMKVESHYGPVLKVERNPGFLKNYLTVGDWAVKVWSEECRESAIIWSPPQKSKITHGTWSSTRLSLIILTQADGVLAFWDILKSQHEPVLTIQVCSEPLVHIARHDAGSLYACANAIGNVFLIEVSQSLADSDRADKNLLTSIFERESKRERILEARLRELRVKMKAIEDGVGQPHTSFISLLDTLGDKDLAEATTEYFATVKKELSCM